MKRLRPLLLILICGLGAGLLLTAAYSLRSEFRLNIGGLGDGPYLSGFNGDEAGIPRYRWTGGPRLKPDVPAVGIVNLPIATVSGANNTLRFTLRAANDAPLVTVTINGVVAGETRAEPNTFKTVEFQVPTEAIGQDTTRVEISSKAFRPEGDSRFLGVQVAEVKLLTGPGLRRPPLDGLIWAWLYVTALAALLLRVAGMERWRWASGAAIVGLLPWLLLTLPLPDGLNLWYTPFYLPIIALIFAAIAGFVWREELSDGLGRFMENLETDARLGRNILIAALGLYLLYALIIILQMDFIGHADYADNAVAARNMVQGRGYSLDYAAQFYQAYKLPRPADTWPPLQPFLTVPFFAVFGPQVWAAKLPNLLLLPVLSLAVWYIGSRLFNRRAALGAALLLPVAVVPAFSNSPAFFEALAYPINDLSFTLLAFLLLGGIVVSGQWSVVSDQKFTIKQFKTQNSKFKTIPSVLSPSILLGLVSGLLFLSKPSGAIFIGLAGVWVLGRKYFGRDKGAISGRSLLIWGGVALLVISPLLIRNLLQFGTPYFSTEQHDAWLTKWNPPDERIYDLFSPFSSKELPHPRQLLEYGWDNNLNAINNQFKKLYNHLLEGQLVPLLLLFLAVIGAIARPFRRSGFGGLLAISFLFYIILFSVLWHYEPRYYLVWLPWAYLFGLYGLSWLCDRITSSQSAEADAISHPKAGYWLTALGFLVLFLPGVNALVTEGPGYTTATGIVTTATWLKQNTVPDAVVMSRNVWELSFHSERKSVMTPNNADLNQVKNVMRQYGASYLQLDHLEADDRGVNRQWGQRAAFWPLLDRQGGKAKGYEGFKLLYDKGGLLVYEWDGR